jgi:hypothetical protein
VPKVPKVPCVQVPKVRKVPSVPKVLGHVIWRNALPTPREVAPLMTAVGDLQRATRIDRGRHPGVVATVYQLVDRGSSDQYRQRVEMAAATSADLTVRVSGPAPAYAFATLSAP